MDELIIQNAIAIAHDVGLMVGSGFIVVALIVIMIYNRIK